MIRLAVSVEGQTEEEFVKVVLDEHLRPLGVAPEPVLIGIGARAGGGSVTVRRLASDMALLYHSHDSVTSPVHSHASFSQGFVPTSPGRGITWNFHLKSPVAAS